MNALTLALIIGFQEPKSTPQQLEASLLATLDKYFWDEGHQRWREAVGKDDQVFLWGYSVLLSTFAIGAKVDPETFKPRMEKAFAGLERYWTDKAPGAYAVSPGQSKTNPDRYYDDNAWVGLAAMEAFDATRDLKYLDIAKKVIRYLRSGEDDKLGGGIYWHENKKESKNACENTPAALLAYKLFKATKDDSYRKAGDRWLKWTEKLIDDTDGLVMDNMKLSGKIDRTKWSYNTGCYILAKWLRKAMLKATDPRFSPQGTPSNLSTSQNSMKKWLDPDHHLVNNPGMFAMHLFEAFLTEDKFLISINGSPSWDAGSESRKYVESIFENCRNENGLVGEYWNRKPLPKEELKLMFTASLLRTSLVARRR